MEVLVQFAGIGTIAGPPARVLARVRGRRRRRRIRECIVGKRAVVCGCGIESNGSNWEGLDIISSL